MRILFVVRSSVDFERFVAIAWHLRGEVVSFVAPDPATRLGGDVHWRFFESLGFGFEQLAVPQDRSRDECLAAAYDSARPDVVVIDQFGPTCASSVVGMRDMAIALGVPTCMIPHGVRVVDSRHAQVSPPSLGLVADVICYTSAEHFARAGVVLNAPGTRYAILGDPRLDQAHIARLQAFGGASAICGAKLGHRRRMAFFGARLEPALVTAINRTHPFADSNDLNRQMLRTLRSTGGCAHVIAKPHPRLGRWSDVEGAAFQWAEDQCDSLALATAADVVATPVSSVALEGLILDKRVIVLDVRQLAPGYRSIFQELRCKPLAEEGSLALIEVPVDSAFLARYCWGGNSGWTVAQRYAETIRAVVSGEDAGMVWTA